MATRINKRAHRGLWGWLLILAAVLGFLVGHQVSESGWRFPPAAETDTQAGTLPPTASDPGTGEEVSFHFIDVGQGDAALIRTPEGDVLIDAGPRDAADDLCAYLDGIGVQTIQYAVFTHPHEDHIGGAAAVIEKYQVRQAYLPDCTSTSQTFLRMMDALDREGTQVLHAVPEQTFSVGGVRFTVLAPISERYASLNNYSVVVRADYGNTSVLYTGDAEDLAEREMLSHEYSRPDALDCDILKVCHHGSDTSSTEDFLRAVSPRYAVISCGKGNKYGHPCRVVLDRLDDLSAETHRTDLEGSVVFVSNGGEPSLKP